MIPNRLLFFLWLTFQVYEISLGQNKAFNQTKTQSQKPNVIIFLVDDLGYTDLGVYGSDFYQTPHVDQLAQSGVRFTDAYAACTVCSPTRASIMSGKYPARLNCTDWITGHKKPFAKMQIPDWTKYLGVDEYTLAEAMKDNGYVTAHMGKWHLGEEEKYWPKNQGFDINVGGWKAGSPRASGGGGYFSPYKNPKMKDGPKNEYLTERLANEASQFIKENKDKPFFLNFCLYNVHTPLQAKKEKIDKYKSLVKKDTHHSNTTYAAMVEHMDDALGKVIQTLKENGLYENTIIIFHSDNGGLRGNFENRKRKVTDNYPLRSGKGDMYEGGVRVPFIVHWPAKIKGGRTAVEPVISMDIYPTVLSLTGSKVKKVKGIDGVDLSGLLLNDISLKREALFWHYPHYHLEGARPYSAMRAGDWKLVEVFEHNTVELYNLKDDIGEQKNLADEKPEKVKALYKKLKKWRKRVKAQFPTPNPNYNAEKENTWKFNKSATLSEEDKKQKE